MPRDDKESGSIFLGLGLGGYGIYLVLYFGNNWIVCRYFVFNILTRNGVRKMSEGKTKQQPLTFDLIDAKVCIAALNEAVRMADTEEREAVANGSEILDKKVVIEHLLNGIKLIQSIVNGNVFIIH